MPLPRLRLLSAAARSTLAGTSTRGAARAKRVASTPYVSGVVAAAIGVAKKNVPKEEATPPLV